MSFLQTLHGPQFTGRWFAAVPATGGRNAPIVPSTSLLVSPLREAQVHDVATQVARDAPLARRLQAGQSRLQAGRTWTQAGLLVWAPFHPPRGLGPASDASAER